MHLGLRHRLAGTFSLLVLCWAPFGYTQELGYSEELPDCRRACESNYWKGVSKCHRSHTLYNDIRQCQDEVAVDKRKCLDRCSQPKEQEPRGCVDRCDREYWDNVSTCYRSNHRYSDIRECENSAKETKGKCKRSCEQRSRETRP